MTHMQERLLAIDLPPCEFSPHPLASSLLLVSLSEWDQHLHDLITGREEEQFVFVLWPYGPISRVTTPQSLQDTHTLFWKAVCVGGWRARLCACVCACNDLGDPPGHLTLPPVATCTDEASPWANWPVTASWICHTHRFQHEASCWSFCRCTHT